MTAWRTVATIACLALACAAGAAGPVREVHGVADAYATPGIALAWAVQRGAGDAATVVIRIAADAPLYEFVAAEGVDPFTQKHDPMLRATRVAGHVDLRVPRERFADFPRTEISFFRTEGAVRAAAPDLIVFYLGVPDTTPEIAGAAKVDAYLAERLRNIRANP